MMKQLKIFIAIIEMFLGFLKIYQEIDLIKTSCILFGSAMTICQITRNDAENRIKEMSKNNWYVKNGTTSANIDETSDRTSLNIDEYISDEISKELFKI